MVFPRQNLREFIATATSCRAVVGCSCVDASLNCCALIHMYIHARTQVRTAGTLQVIEDIPQYADEEEGNQQLLLKGGESSSRSSANSPEPDHQPAGRVSIQHDNTWQCWSKACVLLSAACVHAFLPFWYFAVNVGDKQHMAAICHIIHHFKGMIKGNHTVLQSCVYLPTCVFAQYVSNGAYSPTCCVVFCTHHTCALVFHTHYNRPKFQLRIVSKREIFAIHAGPECTT
jgi:hypothetical protein